MKNKIVKKIIYIFAVIVQILLITSAFVLNSLTDTKAGVMHHVYYKRYEYEQGIYSQSNLTIQSIVAVAICILLAFLLFLAIKKGKDKFHIIQIALGLISGILVYFVINNSVFIDMLAYPYFIMAFEFVLGIQIVIIIISRLVK